MREDTHVTDRNGRLLETIWELNEQFQNEDADEDYLDMQFRAVDHYKQEIRAAAHQQLAAQSRQGRRRDQSLPAHHTGQLDR